VCDKFGEERQVYKSSGAIVVFGKASLAGLQTNDEKQTMSSSFGTNPTRTADGLTAVSQRPNVDPFSE
jgi:hypothetical protein